MRLKKQLLQTSVLVAAAVLASGANAQMVVNLTNIDPSLYTSYDPNGSFNTNLNVVNLGSASTAGGLGAGAVSLLSQQGTNQINSIGFTSTGAASPVVFGNALPVTGPSTVEINTITAAGNQQGGYYSSGSPLTQANTSLTVTNSNWSVANGQNAIPNTNYYGSLQSYGAAPASTLVGGSQAGINQANAVGAAFADNTVVTLNQLPGVAAVPTSLSSSGGPAAGETYTAQPGYDAQNNGAQLNMSVLNNMVAYSTNGSAQVNGQTAGPNGTTLPGTQAGVNTFNTAAIYGNVNLAVSQQADSLGAGGLGSGATTIQSVNQAIAYDAQLGNSQILYAAQSAGDTVGVSNLNQISQTTINQLALGPTSNATGTMTLTGSQSGSLQPIIATNQMVANAGSGSDGILQANNAGSYYNSWTGSFQSGSLTPFPDAAGFPGLATPGSVNSYASAPIATAALSNVGQSIGVSMNSVNAGNVNINTGLAGFSQNIGSLNLAGGTEAEYQPLGSEDGGGLNSAFATVFQGKSSITNLAQGYQVQGNVITSQGNISGGISQFVGGVNFGQGNIANLEYPGGYMANSGPLYGSGPYLITNFSEGLPGNSAVATGAYNTNTTLANVQQAVSAFTNVLSTSGTIDPGAGAMVQQDAGNLANWGGYGGLNMQWSGTAGGNGNAVITGLSQRAALTSNLVAGAAGVNGQVVQYGATLDPLTQTFNLPGGGSYSYPTGYLAPRNVAYAGTLGGAALGNASISGVTFDGTAATLSQSNSRSFNTIATGGSLGSAASPAAIQQQSTSMNFDAGNNNSANLWSPLAGNAVQALTYAAQGMGGNGNATVNNISQSASLSVNSMSAGAGMYGNAVQSSPGMISSLGNSQYSISGCSSSCGSPTYTVGNGNAVLTNATQLTNQSLNTASLVGSINAGNINQQAAGTTVLNTTNQLQSMAGYGYAVATGAQVGTNAVNVITAALH